MADHQVQIELPVPTVKQAWRRYAGHVDSGLRATFAPEGEGATLVTAHSDEGSDAVAGSATESLAEYVDGFVAYVNAAFHELDTTPGATEGAALSGPDGTAHTPEQPRGLGTDNSPPA